MANIYRIGTDVYDATTNQKIPDVATLQKNYSGATEIKAPSLNLPTSVPSSSIVGANVPAPIKPLTPDQTVTNSVMSGLGAGSDAAKVYQEQELQRQTELDKKNTLTTDVNNLITDTGKKGTDLKTQENLLGVPTIQKDIADLNTEMANNKAKYETANINQEGRVASASSIYGRQALLQKKYAVDYGNTATVLTALQGNLTAAKQSAKDTIDLQYESKENELKLKLQQLSNSYNDLSSADKKRADDLALVYNKQVADIATEKETKKNIADVMLVASKNGADATTLKNILNSKDYASAIQAGSMFMGDKGTWTESTTNFDEKGKPLLFNPTTGEYKDSNGNLVSDGSKITSPSGNTYDWTTYNAVGTPEQQKAYIKSVQDSINSVGKLESKTDLENYIANNMSGSNITAQDVINVAGKTGVGWEEMLGILKKESKGGTSNVALKNNNFGGITWTQSYQDSHPGVTKGTARPAKEGGNYVKFATVEDGLMAQAGQFTKRKVTPTTNTNGTPAENWATLIANGQTKINNVPKALQTEVAGIVANKQESANASELKTSALTSAQELLNKFNSGQGTSAVGMSRLFGLQYIPGTKPANFQIQFDNLKSLISLDNVKYLKGQGQVSDAERKLLADASSKLNLSQSEDEFKKALEDIVNGLSGTSTSTDNNSGQTPSGITYTVTK